jgi:hypothetical protein
VKKNGGESRQRVIEHEPLVELIRKTPGLYRTSRPKGEDEKG